MPRRSKLLHCRSRWWKQATHTTARPSKSSWVFDPCNSAKIGKNGPLGCSFAKSLFSNPLVELLQNVQREKAVSPLVVNCCSEFAILFSSHLLITPQIFCFQNLHGIRPFYHKLDDTVSLTSDSFSHLNRFKPTPVRLSKLHCIVCIYNGKPPRARDRQINVCKSYAKPG